MSVNRLGIFVFYDQYGKADEYVEVLLRSLRPLFSRLIITVNGAADNEAIEMFSKYSEDLYVRENKGFDGGAYKDTILHYLKDEEWSKWDELVMFNDTFFGPIHSFENVFAIMETQNIDFWGLCRHPHCGFIDGQEIETHIQSYFLVVKKKMLENEEFFAFWKSLKYHESLKDAIINFEIQFTTYFSERGYEYTSYVDVVGSEELIECKGNPTYVKVYELLEQIEYPIVKKKSLQWKNFIQTKKVFDYVETHSAYEIDLIYKNLNRKYVDEGVLGMDFKALEQFVKNAGRVFIYGNGKWGKNIQAFFEYKKWAYAGVIVTSREKDDEGVYVYHEMHFEGDDYIFLALGKKAFEEVYPIVKRDFESEKIFCPERFELGTK